VEEKKGEAEKKKQLYKEEELNYLKELNNNLDLLYQDKEPEEYDPLNPSLNGNKKPEGVLEQITSKFDETRQVSKQGLQEKLQSMKPKEQTDPPLKPKDPPKKQAPRVVESDKDRALRIQKECKQEKKQAEKRKDPPKLKQEKKPARNIWCARCNKWHDPEFHKKKAAAPPQLQKPYVEHRYDQESNSVRPHAKIVQNA